MNIRGCISSALAVLNYRASRCVRESLKWMWGRGCISLRGVRESLERMWGRGCISLTGRSKGALGVLFGVGDGDFQYTLWGERISEEGE